jgi:hypothetical protein
MPRRLEYDERSMELDLNFARWSKERRRLASHSLLFQAASIGGAGRTIILVEQFIASRFPSLVAPSRIVEERSLSHIAAGGFPPSFRTLSPAPLRPSRVLQVPIPPPFRPLQMSSHSAPRAERQIWSSLSWHGVACSAYPPRCALAQAGAQQQPVNRPLTSVRAPVRYRQNIVFVARRRLGVRVSVWPESSQMGRHGGEVCGRGTMASQVGGAARRGRVGGVMGIQRWLGW